MYRTLGDLDKSKDGFLLMQTADYYSEFKPPEGTEDEIRVPRHAPRPPPEERSQAPRRHREEPEDIDIETPIDVMPISPPQSRVPPHRK